VTELQKEALASVANAVMLAIELRDNMAAVEMAERESSQTNEARNGTAAQGQ
jgi:hypothetical protein